MIVTKGMVIKRRKGYTNWLVQNIGPGYLRVESINPTPRYGSHRLIIDTKNLNKHWEVVE